MKGMVGIGEDYEAPCFKSPHSKLKEFDYVKTFDKETLMTFVNV